MVFYSYIIYSHIQSEIFREDLAFFNSKSSVCNITFKMLFLILTKSQKVTIQEYKVTSIDFKVIFNIFAVEKQPYQNKYNMPSVYGNGKSDSKLDCL